MYATNRLLHLEQNALLPFAYQPSTQSSQAALPVSADLPAGHSKQAVWLALGAFPAAHAVHSEELLSEAMVPALQDELGVCMYE